jgi:hypothetical protein
MQKTHIGNAEIAGSPPLFAPPSASICSHEATMSLLSFLHTSLLDLAERKLGLFFGQIACSLAQSKLAQPSLAQSGALPFPFPGLSSRRRG